MIEGQRILNTARVCLVLVPGTGPFCPSALELLVITGFLLRSHNSGGSYLALSQCGVYPVGESLSTN